MQRIQSFLARLALALAFTAVASFNAWAEDYKIGLLLPFSGVYAGLGEHIENGFRLGLEEFAEGDNFTIVKADSEANPQLALSKTKRLLFQDKVDILSGVVSSAVLAAIRDTVHNAKTPLVVANAGNDHATGKDCSRYIVRVSFSNSQLVRPIAAWMPKQGIKTAYLLAPDYAAGHQMMQTFTKNFSDNGGKVIGSAYPPLKGTSDYSPYLSVAKASGADAIFAFFSGGSAIAFVKQYAQFGLAKDIPLYSVGFLTSPAHLDVQGETASGIFGSTHYLTSLDHKENQHFQKRYQKQYGKTASEFAMAGYDAAHVIAKASQQANNKGEFITQLNKVSFVGPRGQFSIDDKTNNVVQNLYIYKNQWQGGKIKRNILHIASNQRDPSFGCTLP